MHPDEPGTKYCFFSGLDTPGTTEQKNPRTVFVNSMSDLFHARVPLDFVRQVFEVMADTPQHTYQGRCHVVGCVRACRGVGTGWAPGSGPVFTPWWASRQRR
ncbi:DUF5131 family protein [Streptomyces sp. NPDC056358]|uniref:DUF5131 family protein n=1 Tax=Streptomyces sp. NPDC056358 TaxID=3345794 RepID=UPI0035DE696A